MNFDIGVCRLKHPLFLLRDLIKLYPPPEPCELFAEDILIDPEIDRDEQCHKDKIQQLEVFKDKISILK